MRLVEILIILHLSLLLFHRSSLANERGRDRSRLYTEAQEAYKNDRLADSVRLLKSLIQSEPKHQDGLLLLGTIYYQNQKLRKAKALFDRVEVSSINILSAFAWGATYMQFRDYDRAIPAFRYNLKNKGPYRDFALYYLGVIYYKKGQWSRSRRFLQNADASQLPVFLRVNRRKYLSSIRQRQDKMLESILSASEKRNLDLNMSEPTEELGVAPENPTQDELLTIPSGAYRPFATATSSSPWRWMWRPSFALVQQTSLLDNHGLNNDSVSIIAHRQDLGGSLTYQPNRDSGGFSGDLQIAIGSRQYEARLRKTRYFQIEQSTGVFTTQEDSKDSEHSGSTLLRTSLGWGLSEHLRFEIGGSLSGQLPEYDKKQAWGQSAAALGIRYDGSHTELGIELSSQQPFDEEQKKIAKDIAARGEVESDLGLFRIRIGAYHWETDNLNFVSLNRFRYILIDPQLRYRVGFQSETGGNVGVLVNMGEAALQGQFETYRRDIENQSIVNRVSELDSVETAVSRAEKSAVSLSVPLLDFLTMKAAASYNLLGDYVFTDRDQNETTIQTYRSDVGQVIGQMQVILSFADWIRLSAHYTATRQTYRDASTKAVEFRRKNPDYIEESSIFLELSKGF